MSVMNSPTIESNSFGVDLNGTFRTAAYGGEALEVKVAPTVDNTFEPGGMG